MLDHGAARLALRATLAGLSVATTGAVTLAASATGGQDNASAYTRAAGSFFADGFAVGMEVTATGFATGGNNRTAVITYLTATVMTVNATLATDVAAAGCTIRCLQPTTFLVENVGVQPVAGQPYFSEQYLPGPQTQRTVGVTATLDVTPMYVVGVGVPTGTGDLAASAYVNALLTAFAPGTAITVGTNTLRVRQDTAPFAGQLLRLDTGWMVQTVSIPLRAYTSNAI